MTDATPHLNEGLSLIQKLHSETALIAWHELQKFFAQGVVIVVKDSLNLVDMAVLFAEDESSEISKLLDSKSIAYPGNDQARKWYDDDTQLWSVVVAPYILVQEQMPGTVH